jgi:hypothetical protein
MRRAAAGLAVLVLAACAPPPLDSDRELAGSGPVVVVGSGPDAASARACAAQRLRARMRAEIERREAIAVPSERIHDGAAVERALERLSAGLAGGDAVLVHGEAFVSVRVSGQEFEAALRETRAAGRGGHLRVACVPLDVQGSGRELYELRERYDSALREALAAQGLVPLSTDEVYAALEKGGDAALARHGRADAIVSGKLRREGVSIVLEIVLRDARTGRSAGSFTTLVDPPDVGRVARRHALLLERGLGVEP